MEGYYEKASIISLPDEIITIILLNNEPQDIMSFGLTCTKFFDIVTKNEYLWRVKYSEIAPKKIVEYIQSKSGGSMLQEVENVYKLRQKICTELQSMSSKYYAQINEVSLEHVRNFFAIATENHISFYYTIHILQDIVKKGYNMIKNFECLNPLYSLTSIYYAKIVLRHLIHTFLAIKWVRELKRGSLLPHIVITFFLQWLDSEHIHTDEEVFSKIQVLVKRVKMILDEGRSNPKLEHSERDVLQAITQAIYTNDKFLIAQSVKTDNLNIVKVIEEGDGVLVVYGAIYQAVARCFGVKCELIAFSNHLFLEWRDTQSPYSLYTIDLLTGQLRPKRSCPYSHNANYCYDPEPLIHYLFSMYMTSKGTYRDCDSQNAIHLLDFLSFHRSHTAHNPYERFFDYLMDNVDDEGFKASLDMAFLRDSQLSLIMTLSNLNTAEESVTKCIFPKNHPPEVKYAVGMVCYHQLYDYICVVVGWEVGCTRAIPNLDGTQLCYRVIAGDQSERYVAQVHLNPVTPPFRIPSLEDAIARDFTHFDGYTYVLNEDKKKEYPSEQAVIEVFKNMVDMSPGIKAFG